MKDGFLLEDVKLESKAIIKIKSIKIHHEYDARPLIES